MAQTGGVKERWIQPGVFLANNAISLIGVGLTTASALILIGFWVIDVFGRGGSSNPYVGIVVDLCLPALFVLGLILIPLGIVLRRRKLKAAGQLPAEYPKVDLSSPVLREALIFVAVATFLNFVIVGTASYRSVAYMDTPNFCGQTCHVMTPEFAAYQVYPHSHVACTECHIASGIPGFIHAKLNGTKQLVQVVFENYPRPIMPEGKVPAASQTCVHCHNPGRFIGDKLMVTTAYGDDETNPATKSLVLLHVGGKDLAGHLSGIHGAHLGHIEYISRDTTNQTIPWVAKVSDNGSITEYVSSDAKQPVTGEKRVMDCLDCHNRAAHTFDTPEKALNKAMQQGRVEPSLPFVHKEGLALVKAEYTSQAEADSKIISGLQDFYRTQHPDVWNQKQSQIEQSAKALSTIYDRNVFPFMKVTWGTHPNNIGHNDYPGCFRCHDGSHNAKDGSSINNDCSVCHNLLAVDEANPKQLTDLGLQ
jgi:nitrate/TMAO reductase-like tetraheme cytochrome c subunit